MVVVTGTVGLDALTSGTVVVVTGTVGLEALTSGTVVGITGTVGLEVVSGFTGTGKVSVDSSGLGSMIPKKVVKNKEIGIDIEFNFSLNLSTTKKNRYLSLFQVSYISEIVYFIE